MDELEERADAWLADVALEQAVIESLPFVKGEVGFTINDQSANLSKVHVSVWCCWENSRRSFKQVFVCCDDESKPTHLEALRELRRKLIREHGVDGHPVHPKAMDRRKELETDEMQERTEPRTFFERMRLAAAAQTRTQQKADHDALLLEKARSAEANAIRSREEAERQARSSQAAADALKPAKVSHKRQKTAFSASCSHARKDDAKQEDGGVAEEEENQWDWRDWTLEKWRRLEATERRRRLCPIEPFFGPLQQGATRASDPNAPLLRGENGWRWHSRRGVIGNLQSWARGNRENLIVMLAECATHFGVADEVVSKLGFKLDRSEVEDMRVYQYIVKRAAAAIKQLKQCRTEQERADYHIVLGALAPERVAAGDQSGMIAKVSTALGVTRGARYCKRTGEKRQCAFDKAIECRESFDNTTCAKSFHQLQPGMKALSRGRECTIKDINHEADTCTLSFSCGGVVASYQFSCIYKGIDAPAAAKYPKGSARLCPLPPSLRPQARTERCDAKAEAAREKVQELFDAEGARSPAQRDHIRRRVGSRLYESAQALIVYAKYAALYSLYLVRYPAHHISFSLFKKLRPWYVRRAKEESCLCKQCENFKQYQATLRTVPRIFKDLLQPSSLDADEMDSDDEEETGVANWAGKSALERLCQFCEVESKSDMVRSVMCEGSFDGAGKTACINCSCDACGFKKLWYSGLRPHVVDNDGKLLPSAPLEFQTELKWLRLRSNKKDSPGAEKQSSYEPHYGTVDVQFLDNFEECVIKKYCHHRFTIQRQKAMDAQFHRNRWPGWIQFDIDFAMDGTIPPPGGRAAQQEHWSPMTYTLFINVVSWLRTDVWISRTCALNRGDAVTVEPADTSLVGATTPAVGSYWAEVLVKLPVSPTESNDAVDAESHHTRDASIAYD